MNRKGLIGLALLACTAAGMVYTAYAVPTIENQAARSADALSRELSASNGANPILSAGSNPYDFIENSREYKRIVKLGPGAIPVLDKKIEQSADSGLTVYAFAAAIEEISQVDLKEKESTAWATGKEFARKWEFQLSTLPEKVEEISGSSRTVEEKNAALEKLGVPAVPFILDRVAAGNTELFPSAHKLIVHADPGTGILQVTDAAKWAEKHKNEFNALKEYVLSKKQTAQEA
ncbi:hypothetical protein QWJ34_20820 [Saccharibacillus sp. CPCC 101409]|uniref:hypothetical protein n=1 Tax=Saccharibacillus sp. CPCC 101409 TaxID=3058041 RepID=UPI002671A135|nr:hypothetical protein [Saccharibacillus sp. CPCC 101409]MDO3412219.1 hypothetical protein [Saccharibacillus sp. CPCC 101409]